jgi:hypothetical protein
MSTISLAPTPKRHGPLVDTGGGMAGAKTVTSALHRLVRDEPRTRAEFLSLTGG